MSAAATRARRRRTGATVPLVLAGLLALLGATVGPGASLAQAHNVLLSTSPASGSTVAVLPDLIVLHYDLPAQALGTAVVLAGPSGNVADGPAQLINSDVDQPVRPGSPAGRYTVEWRVVSADGHIVQGSFVFTADARSTGTASPLPSAIRAGGAATRASAPASRVEVIAAAIGVLVVVVVIGLAVLTHRPGRSRPPDDDEEDGSDADGPG